MGVDAVKESGLDLNPSCEVCEPGERCRGFCRSFALAERSPEAKRAYLQGFQAGQTMRKKYTVPDNIDDVRRRAWETRRKKYGTHGHSGSYSRSSIPCASCRRLTDAIVRLHIEEVLSEGQAAKLIGIDRVELRKLADASQRR